MLCMRLARLAFNWDRPIVLVVLFWVLFGSRLSAQPVAEFPSVPFQPPTTTGAGSISVVLKHVGSMTLKRVLGDGRSADLWTVGVCNETAGKVVAPRVRIMGAFAVTDLPNDLAEDVVGRQTSANPKSVIGDNGDTILGLGASGLALGGIASGTAAASYAGVGMAGLQLVFRILAKQAPSATPYFSKLLPDVVGLDPGACGQWYLFSSLMRDTRSMRASVVLP